MAALGIEIVTFPLYVKCCPVRRLFLFRLAWMLPVYRVSWDLDMLAKKGEAFNACHSAYCGLPGTWTRNYIIMIITMAVWRRNLCIQHPPGRLQLKLSNNDAVNGRVIGMLALGCKLTSVLILSCVCVFSVVLLVDTSTATASCQTQLQEHLCQFLGEQIAFCETFNLVQYVMHSELLHNPTMAL